MSLKKQSFPKSLKDRCIKILFEKYKKEPEIVSRFLPEIFNEFERVYKKRKPMPKIHQRIFPSDELTEMTKESIIKKANGIIEKFKAQRALEREEVIELLQYISALKTGQFLSNEVFFKYIFNVLNINLDKKKIEKIQDGNIDKRFVLRRGVTLYLSWDYKLIKIEIDPEELNLRRKALSIVGIGEENVSNVAEEHDKYLNEAYIH